MIHLMALGIGLAVLILIGTIFFLASEYPVQLIMGLLGIILVFIAYLIGATALGINI